MVAETEIIMNQEIQSIAKSQKAIFDVLLAKKSAVQELADMEDIDLAEAMNSHDCKQEKCAVCLEWRDRGLKAADYMEDNRF